MRAKGGAGGACAGRTLLESEPGSRSGTAPTGGAHLSAVEEKGKEWEAGLG